MPRTCNVVAVSCDWKDQILAEDLNCAMNLLQTDRFHFYDVPDTHSDEFVQLISDQPGLTNGQIQSIYDNHEPELFPIEDESDGVVCVTLEDKP